MTDAKRQRANANRVEARQVLKHYAANARYHLGDEAADALKNAKPSNLVAVSLALEGANPELAASLRSGINRPLPGSHNMVTVDRRERTSAHGKIENSGKGDPYALAQVQRIMTTIDAAAAMDATDSGVRNRIFASVAVRDKALDVGLLDGNPIGKKGAADLNDDQKRFYASLDPREVLHLTSVQQRVDDAFFTRHLREATFHSSARRQDCPVPLLNDKGVPRTLDELLRDNKPGEKLRLAEGLFAYKTGDGQFRIEDKEGRVTLPASGFMRGTQVIDNLPVIDDITMSVGGRKKRQASSAGQRIVEESLLDPESPTGRAHRIALKQAALTNVWNSGVPVNHGEVGKAAWQNHSFLVRSGIGVNGSTGLTRRSGIALQSHFAARQAILDDEHARRMALLNIPTTTEKSTALGAARTAPARNYSGPVASEDRKLIERSGYRLRTFAKGTVAPESAAASRVPLDAFDKAPKDHGYTAADIRDGGTLRNAADLAHAANALSKVGRHPDLAGDHAFVAQARLQDVFRRQAAAPKDEPVAVSTYDSIPEGWDDSKGDFLSTVFAQGSRVDTNGYTVGTVAGSDAAKRTGPGLRRRPFRVKYLTRSAALTPTGEAIINDRAAFRVHSVDRSGDVPTVYMVSDDYAADLASIN